jgi:hypothetical protein
MSATIAGSFSTASVAVAGNTSDILPIPTGTTTAKLTLTGCDASNTVRTQKRTAGGTWTNQTTYSSNQSAVSITVAAGEEWQLAHLTAQAYHDLQFKLTTEN